MNNNMSAVDVLDGDIVGIDNDGNSILWNAETLRGENSGEPPTAEELAALARCKGEEA